MMSREYDDGNSYNKNNKLQKEEQISTEYNEEETPRVELLSKIKNAYGRL